MIASDMGILWPNACRKNINNNPATSQQPSTAQSNNPPTPQSPNLPLPPSLKMKGANIGQTAAFDQERPATRDQI